MKFKGRIRFRDLRTTRLVLNLLRQGMTPREIAWTLALGSALGVFPVLGTTTILCALTSILFKLNLPLMLVANYLVYPLQFILLLPFYRLGGWFFNASLPSLSLSQVLQTLRHDPFASLSLLGGLTWHAVAAWCLVAAVWIPLYHFLLELVFLLARKKNFFQN
jgi:uncharacterized protein (DUF2062 family)